MEEEDEDEVVEEVLGKSEVRWIMKERKGIGKNVDK